MSYEIYREMAEEDYFRNEAIAAWAEEVERETNLYQQGESDGRRHKLPQHPEQYIYWQGYCDGLQQFWFKRLKLSIPEEI